MSASWRDRLEELLVEQALSGLEPERIDELRELLDSHPEAVDDSLELAAAAVHLAALDQIEEMPAALRRQVAADGRRVLAEQTAERPLSFPRAKPESTAAPASGRLLTWSGWLAAAAALIFAVAIREQPQPELPEVERAELLARVSDAATLAWATTDDPTAKGASGDVVWSQAEQAGFMRFRGLAANDPSEFQYQLWIFDAERDERYPVDGGVFDVTASGETVVPIQTKLAVTEATLFAITVEKPGGVVVSSRERIALLATAPS